MYYSVRMSFQKRLIRRETINVRGGRVNEGRESRDDSVLVVGFLISGDGVVSRVSESLNRRDEFGGVTKLTLNLT